MTKEEDDWLSDFLEAAQASLPQSLDAAEKEYGARVQLLAPRYERARTGDTDGELAKRIAVSEALAAQKKWDDASDVLDEASLLAAQILLKSTLAAGTDPGAPKESDAPVIRQFSFSLDKPKAEEEINPQEVSPSQAPASEIGRVVIPEAEEQPPRSSA